MLLGQRLIYCLITGFVVVGLFLPGVAAVIALWGCGMWVFYGCYEGLRQESIAINAHFKILIYTRDNNPREFWFYTILFGIDGLAFCAWAIYFATHYPIFHITHYYEDIGVAL